jgi:general secretion pathway protein D
MIDDGQIVVLGGLIRDDFKDTVEMLPGLGKIPLLGIFFLKKGKAAVKTNLMVFLRPKIVRTASDLAGYTRQKYERMRGTQMQSLPDSGFLLYKDKPPVLPQLEPENEPASR